MTQVLRKRGAALIVVLGVLVVLALLATTFASLQGVERQVSRNYLDKVHAELASISGIEAAISELRGLTQKGLIPVPGAAEPWRYWGDNTLETGPANLSLPVAESQNPSYAVEVDQDPYSGPVTPVSVTIEGKTRGFSGVLSAGTYGRHGNQYVLRVSDASGKIHLNDGLNQYLANDSSTSRNLRRILNQLGSAPSVSVANLGDLVVQNRPVPGYKSVYELKRFLTDAQFLAVRDHVTAHAWVDPNVVNPVPFTDVQAQSVAAEFPALATALYPGVYWRGSPARYRIGRGKDYRGIPLGQVDPAWGTLQVYPSTKAPPFPGDSLEHAIYGTDELNPQWIEVTSRAPVNVNAASREVLVALLSDLRGVFVAERRRNNLETSEVGMYHFLSLTHTYSPGKQPVPWNKPSETYYNVPEGDEVGFLYETYPIVGPGSGSISGISAFLVAEHLLACRESRATQGVVPSEDYSSAPASPLPFRGPFRNWRQFHAFCDHLVTINVLEDPRRNTFFDHAPGPLGWAGYPWGGGAGNLTGYTPFTDSPHQRRMASQAIADALKANFNPNVHLNELNPDRNRFLLVDKTDLVVNSTEFLFTPTGHYDIESLGRVLRPRDSSEDVLLASDNFVMAESEIHAGVKLYDLLRETTQKQFLGGTLTARNGSDPTNNNRTLEIGPEPHNGPAPAQNEWSGYVALPTTGGTGLDRPAGTAAESAPLQGSEFQETIHAHLALDFKAEHHQDGDPFREDLGSRNVDPREKVENFPDPGETLSGPYDPNDGDYRLARSFRIPSIGGLSQSMPVLPAKAPADLRIDGGYLERHCGLAYWISTSSYVPTTRAKEGVLSYWVKPNYFPEHSGKPRLYADLSQRTKTAASSPWDGWFSCGNWLQFWNAGHNAVPPAAPVDESRPTWWEPINMGALRFGSLPVKPQAMLFGVGHGWCAGYSNYADIDGTVLGGGKSGYYQYMATPSLNHVAHADASVQISEFSAHEWMHVALAWRKATTAQPTYSMWMPSILTGDYEVAVNGRILSGSVEVLLRIFEANERDGSIDWTRHYNGDQNSVRIGRPSKITSLDTTEGETHYNFSADSTVDEFYFWNRRGAGDGNVSRAIGLYSQGRYSLPKGPGEGEFLSAPVAMPGLDGRGLAPEGGVPPPVVSGNGAGAGAGSTLTAASSVCQILGMSWSWFSEPYRQDPGGNWNPTPITNWFDPSAPSMLTARVEARLEGLGAGYVSDDGYSPLIDAAGNPVTVAPGSPFRYRLKFSVTGPMFDPLNTVLRTTSYVDDVTFFVSCGETEFTYYFCNTGTK